MASKPCYAAIICGFGGENWYLGSDDPAGDCLESQVAVQMAIAGTIALQSVGCGTCDTLTTTACELRDRLAVYSSDGEADEVIEWMAGTVKNFV